jgi:streptogramin lyase
VPTADAWACDLEAHDVLFFTERDPSKIGRFDPSSRRFDEWDVPTSHGYPVGLLAFGDTVFFVEAWSCRLGRLVTTSGQFTEWTIPNATPDWTGYPGLDRDTAGHVWLTNSQDLSLLVEVAIGAGDTAEFREWTVPGSPFCGPMDVVADGDGRIWYSIEAQDENGDTSKVGVLDPARQEYQEWQLPYEGAAPYYLELDAGGYVWVGENGGAAVGRLSPSENEFTTYPIGISQGYIYDYTLDGRGNLWVACYDDRALVKFSCVATGVSERRGLRPSDDRLAVWPNPFSSRVHCPPLLKCSVFDRCGRLVAEVRNGVWDGRGLDGREVGAGVYVITAGAGGPVAVVKLR